MKVREIAKKSVQLFVGCFLLFVAVVAQGTPSKEKAVVLAAFGTSYESALPAILNIQKQVQAAMPEVPVRLAFTSNIIRRIWQKRDKDPQYIKNHPEIPASILHVKGPLATIADFQDEGYGYIIVQPTYISSGEEFADLGSYVDAFNSIRTIKRRNMPLRRVLLGRPALGTYGIVHEYLQDIEDVAEVLARDVQLAKKQGRDLIYFAHGNEHYSTGVYMEFEQIMRKRYPGLRIYVTVVEGFPGADILLKRLEADNSKKVILKPFMTVAGDHAKNDMAGPEPDSLKSVLTAHGIDVAVVLDGLGKYNNFAAIFAEHAKDALKDAGPSL